MYISGSQNFSCGASEVIDSRNGATFVLVMIPVCLSQLNTSNTLADIQHYAQSELQSKTSSQCML